MGSGQDQERFSGHGGADWSGRGFERAWSGDNIAAGNSPSAVRLAGSPDDGITSRGADLRTDCRPADWPCSGAFGGGRGGRRRALRRRGDLDAVRVDFAERAAPTVVTLNGQDLLSRGSVWISRADGIVIETELHQASKAINLEAQMRVTFRRQASLDLWVPARMDELYKQQVGWFGSPPRTAVIAETIECTATYSDYRRFETSGRILVPEP
jgi:hypothetical protein